MAHPIFHLASSESESTALIAGLLSIQGSGSEDGGNGGPAAPDFKYIFVTADATDGNFAALPFSGTSSQRADGFCNVDTNRPDTSVSYKAMIVQEPGIRRACSTSNCSGGSAEHIDWVFSPDTEYRRPDGTTVIGTTIATAGIFTFILDNSIDGTPVQYWTGIQGNWLQGANHCSNWATNSSFIRGEVGLGNSTNDIALDAAGFQPCNTGFSLVCVEQ